MQSPVILTLIFYLVTKHTINISTYGPQCFVNLFLSLPLPLINVVRLLHLSFTRFFPRWFFHTISHAVLFGPNKYGVCGLIKTFTNQGICTINILRRHLHSKIEVSRFVLILFSFLQLHACIHQPYLE